MRYKISRTSECNDRYWNTKAKNVWNVQYLVPVGIFDIFFEPSFLSTAHVATRYFPTPFLLWNPYPLPLPKNASNKYNMLADFLLGTLPYAAKKHRLSIICALILGKGFKHHHTQLKVIRVWKKCV